MQEDTFPAAEKILFDIENILKKDYNLISFEIIPVEDNKNKSPVLHTANSLGLASWCIEPLYCYVYNSLLDLRRKQNRREKTEVISRWLLGALLLNPEVSTFWNMRREIIRNGRLNPIEELRIVKIILYYKAKCFEAFSYRRWILKLLIVNNQDFMYDMEQILSNEIQITLMAANRHSNNCHAWNHRQHIISMLELLSICKINNFLDNEWEESTKWCNLHVSDYSGFTYRQFLLKKLLSRKQHIESEPYSKILNKRQDIIFNFVNMTKECKDVFLNHDGSYAKILSLLHGVQETEKSCENELKQTLINLSYWVEDCMINEELINIYPGHEALWYHRRFLVFSLLSLNYSYSNFFFYNIESLNPLQSSFPIKNNLDSMFYNVNLPKSLLQIAFKSRNSILINSAKQFGNYENHLAKKFFDFLAAMKLDS